jgi:hypothetical protein
MRQRGHGLDLGRSWPLDAQRLDRLPMLRVRLNEGDQRGMGQLGDDGEQFVFLRPPPSLHLGLRPLRDRVHSRIEQEQVEIQQRLRGGVQRRR